MFAATRKLFDDFTGLAFNFRLDYSEGRDFEDFLRNNQEILVKGKNQYGLFPIIANYPGAVDVVVFAKDQEHQEQLLAKVNA